ncbi:hypothetical protein [Arenicella xantha]|uniref:Uncharacterized protein n=1 Tax=Arenicella xantha TaxID=644221 RepID=A0A395JMZ9_9GAMM|nr:hypothetical protein [Arenicella xantha]RBP52857.1 hypothetical protein DFR28_101241 [Arenicella xantha]
MKHLVLSLTMISSLLISATSMASDITSHTIAGNTTSDHKIDTVYVVSNGDAANFEVYSLNIAQSAIEDSVELMVESFSDKLAKGNTNKVSIDASAGSAI